MAIKFSLLHTRAGFTPKQMQIFEITNLKILGNHDFQHLALQDITNLHQKDCSQKPQSESMDSETHPRAGGEKVVSKGWLVQIHRQGPSLHKFAN